MSVRKKFITAREAVNDMKGNNGQPLMVPLTGSLYVRGKLSDNEKYIVGTYQNIFYISFQQTIIIFFRHRYKLLCREESAGGC